MRYVPSNNFGNTYKTKYEVYLNSKLLVSTFDKAAANNEIEKAPAETFVRATKIYSR